MSLASPEVEDAHPEGYGARQRPQAHLSLVTRNFPGSGNTHN